MAPHDGRCSAPRTRAARPEFPVWVPGATPSTGRDSPWCRRFHQRPRSLQAQHQQAEHHDQPPRVCHEDKPGSAVSAGASWRRYAAETGTSQDPLEPFDPVQEFGDPDGEMVIHDHHLAGGQQGPVDHDVHRFAGLPGQFHHGTVGQIQHVPELRWECGRVPPSP